MSKTDNKKISISELMKIIADEYNALPKQLKIVASYIESNQTNLMLKRISDIAQTCNIQPSAIVRFAKHFGFSGFSEMQMIFREAYTAKNSPNYQQRIRKLIDQEAKPLSNVTMAREFIQANREGLDDFLDHFDEVAFEKAVDLLLKAENIYVVGMRRSFPIANYLVYALQHTNKRVHLISSIGGMLHEQIRSINKNDVLIAISFAEYAKETQVCLRHAHQRHAETIVITDSQLSPLIKHSSVAFTVREGSAFAFRSLTNAMCLSQAIFISLAYRLEVNIEDSEFFD